MSGHDVSFCTTGCILQQSELLNYNTFKWRQVMLVACTYFYITMCQP